MNGFDFAAYASGFLMPEKGIHGVGVETLQNCQTSSGRIERDATFAVHGSIDFLMQAPATGSVA
jgi:hypothetical protein